MAAELPFPKVNSCERVTVIVDKREPPAMFETLSSIPGINVVSAVLNIGDFAIYDKDGTPRVAVERKSWSDLRASFTDKRSNDQGIRMAAGCQQADVRQLYVIEHAKIAGWESEPTGISDKLLDCSVNRLIAGGVGVLRTGDKKHTCDVIGWLAKRVGEGKLGGFHADGVVATKGTTNEISFRKSGNLSKEKIFWNMLQCSNGISLAKAKQISGVWPTAARLAAAYNEQPSRKRKEAMVSDKKLKGIGPTLSKRLCAVFADEDQS